MPQGGARVVGHCRPITPVRCVGSRPLQGPSPLQARAHLQAASYRQGLAAALAHSRSAPSSRFTGIRREPAAPPKHLPPAAAATAAAAAATTAVAMLGLMAY